MRAAAEAAAERRPQLEAMKRKTEEWLRTGKVSAPITTGGEPVADR